MSIFEELTNILASFSLPSIKNDIIPLWPKDLHLVNSCCVWDASPAINKSDLFKIDFFLKYLNEGPLWHHGFFLGNGDSRRRFIRKKIKRWRDSFNTRFFWNQFQTEETELNVMLFRNILFVFLLWWIVLSQTGDNQQSETDYIK